MLKYIKFACKNVEISAKIDTHSSQKTSTYILEDKLGYFS